jgi:hypothetical protein
MTLGLADAQPEVQRPEHVFDVTGASGVLSATFHKIDLRARKARG